MIFGISLTCIWFKFSQIKEKFAAISEIVFYSFILFQYSKGEPHFPLYFWKPSYPLSSIGVAHVPKFCLFEIGAMQFPCNGHLLCCVKIPTVLLMFFNKLASCSVPCGTGLHGKYIVWSVLDILNYINLFHSTFYYKVV